MKVVIPLDGLAGFVAVLSIFFVVVRQFSLRSVFSSSFLAFPALRLLRPSHFHEKKKKTRLFPNRTGEKTAHAGFESWNLYHLSITQLLYAIWIDKPQSNLEVVQFFYFILADSLSLSLNVISPTMRHCVGIVNMDSMHIAALKESPALQLCQWRITGFWRTE